jgi:hypothetical protein
MKEGDGFEPSPSFPAGNRKYIPIGIMCLSSDTTNSSYAANPEGMKVL